MHLTTEKKSTPYNYIAASQQSTLISLSTIGNQNLLFFSHIFFTSKKLELLIIYATYVHNYWNLIRETFCYNLYSVQTKYGFEFSSQQYVQEKLNFNATKNLFMCECVCSMQVYLKLKRPYPWFFF